jgi:hypothetical protein
MRVEIKSFGIKIVSHSSESRFSENFGSHYFHEKDELKDNIKVWDAESIRLLQEKNLGVQDIISCIYALRSSKREVGEKFTINTFHKEGLLTLAATYIECKLLNIACLGPDSRPQLKLRLSPGAEFKSSRAATFLNDENSALWVDQLTGMITAIEVKVPSLPLPIARMILQEIKY